jgi:ABC-2 type transport system ATP-binding protein
VNRAVGRPATGYGDLAGGDLALSTHALTKRFGPVTAVDSLDLQVGRGDIYGFLGANGSGKTTTIRMLLGLVLATSGRAELLGQPVPRASRSVLPRVGALIEGPAAYGHLSGRQNLELLDASGPRASGGGSGRRRRIEVVLEQVGLSAVGRRPVGKYSLGMRQRLGLAGALLREPELLILDEPTNGLDPQGIREVRDLLLALHAGGTTVFVSSHLLAEVEQIATRVGVLDRGRLVLQADLTALQQPTGHSVLVSPDVEQAVGILNSRVLRRDGDRLLVATEDTARLNAELVRAGVRVTELAPERRSLEQVVLAATDPDHPRLGQSDGGALL